MGVKCCSKQNTVSQVEAISSISGYDIKYCNCCKRNVIPSKSFNWVCFTFFLGIFYLPYYLLKSKKCPYCGEANFSQAK